MTSRMTDQQGIAFPMKQRPLNTTVDFIYLLILKVWAQQTAHFSFDLDRASSRSYQLHQQYDKLPCHSGRYGKHIYTLATKRLTKKWKHSRKSG